MKTGKSAGIWQIKCPGVASIPMSAIAQRIQHDLQSRAANDDCFKSGPGTRTKYAYVNNNPLTFIDPSGFTPSFDYQRHLERAQAAMAWCMERGGDCLAAYQDMEYYSDQMAQWTEWDYMMAFGDQLLSEYDAGWNLGPGWDARNIRVANFESRTVKGVDGKTYEIDPLQFAIAIHLVREWIPLQLQKVPKDWEYFGVHILANGNFLWGEQIGDKRTLTYPGRTGENAGVPYWMNVHLHPGFDQHMFSREDMSAARRMPVFIGTMKGDIHVFPQGMSSVNNPGFGINLCNGCAKRSGVSL